MKTPIRSQASRKSKRRDRFARPGVEALEGRQVLSAGLAMFPPGPVTVYHPPGPIIVAYPPNPC
jgi:hypothetical protein